MVIQNGKLRSYLNMAAWHRTLWFIFEYRGLSHLAAWLFKMVIQNGKLCSYLNMAAWHRTVGLFKIVIKMVGWVHICIWLLDTVLFGTLQMAIQNGGVGSFLNMAVWHRTVWLFKMVCLVYIWIWRLATVLFGIQSGMFILLRSVWKDYVSLFARTVCARVELYISSMNIIRSRICTV